MMISSLFSVFDPTSTPFDVFGVGKWVFALSSLSCVSWSVFSRLVGMSVVFSRTIGVLKGSALQYTSGVSALTILPVLVCLFFTIFWWNEVGLVPFGFGLTSHLAVNFSLAAVLFASGVLGFVIFQGWSKLVSHMVPYGAPFALSFVLVLVETVSFLIRPITLALRLTGNMVTGHLLVALLCEAGSYVMVIGPVVSVVAVILSSSLLLFEVMVSLVQAAIFSTLIFIYWTES